MYPLKLQIVYKYINQVKKGRDYFKKKIRKLGFNVIGGQSNFLLVNFKNEKKGGVFGWAVLKWVGGFKPHPPTRPPFLAPTFLLGTPVLPYYTQR